jgi:hypothetical protein
LTFPVEGSYADETADVDAEVEHGWNHSLGEIVTLLADNGSGSSSGREARARLARAVPRGARRLYGWPTAGGPALMYSSRPHVPAGPSGSTGARSSAALEASKPQRVIEPHAETRAASVAYRRWSTTSAG